MGQHWWEAKEEKLRQRNWGELKGEWLPYVAPDIVECEFSEHTISELPQLRPVVENAKHGVDVEVENVPGLRDGILREGVLMLKKASNAMAGAFVHVDFGMCSWSLSSAYHAAFFAMKAIQHFLGFAVVEFDKSFMIDVWPPPEPLSSKRKKRGETPMRKMLFVKLQQNRLEHQPMWAFFERLIRITTVDDSVWPSSVTNSLARLESGDFAGQRNRLHYRNSAWPFPEDINRCVRQAGFGGIADSEEFLDADRSDFSVVLAVVLLWMGGQLLQDMAKSSNVIRTVWEQVSEWLQEPHNQLYQDAGAQLMSPVRQAFGQSVGRRDE